MKKILPSLLGMLLPLFLLAQNPGFENDFTSWLTGTAPWTITTTANQFRSGIKAAKLTTNSTTDITNYPTTGQTVTVPGSGTNYVTVIAYVRGGAGNTNNAAAVGGYDGANFTKGVETTGISSAGFVVISHTFLATNGATYQPVLYGRSTSGNIELYYDDVIIYTSTSATTDLTAPTAAARISVTTAGSTLGLSWTAGTDTGSGIDGTLILRTTGTSAVGVTPTAQTFYNTATAVGPAAIGSFNVRANGSASGSYSESVTNNTVYTYVIFMRDKAYNYSPVARIFVFNGTGLSASTTNNSSLNGLYLPAGNTFTTLSSSTITLASTSIVTIGGTINNQGNFNNSNASLTFESGSVYNYNRNNAGSFSIPTATWAPGSFCRVTGVSTTGPTGTGQQFANFEWNSTGQTGAATLASNFGATGTVTIASTGTGSLRFPATGNHSFAGNVTQNGGTVVFEPGNTVAMNGTNAQILTVNGPLQNLTINNTAGVSLGRSATVATGLLLSRGTFSLAPRSLTMGDGATITRNAGQLSETPTFTNNVNVTYTAALTTGPELPTATGVLQTLTLNTPGSVTLSQAATANTTLDFAQGYLLLGNNDFTLGDAAGITNASASQFVVTNGTGLLTQRNLGPAGRSGTVTFPVGSSPTSYTPATLTNTGTTDAFSVRVYPNVFDNYDAAGNATGGTLTDHVVDRTWAITEGTTGDANLAVDLTWNATNEIGGFTRSQSFVSYFAGGKWNGANATAAAGSNPYSQTRSGITTLGAFGVGDQLSALPVTWLSFQARERADGSVRLDWVTTAEIDNDYFAVERAGADAKIFTEIGRVAGRGTTDRRVDYTFHDAAPAGKEIYYRLRQVDYDGSFSYSAIVRVVRAVRGEADLFRVVSQADGQVTLAIDAAGPVTLQLFTLDGRQLRTTLLNAPGTYTQALPAAGIYLLRAQTSGGEQQTRKLLGR